MTSLRDLRVFFSGLVPGLIDEGFKRGYDVAIGEVVRGKAQADWNAAHGLGISTSLHLVGLAVDLILYKAGVYLTGSQGYAELGAYWKTRSHLCAWGGDFTTRDYGHFSVTYDGRR